jgi:hypothetical protein
MKSLLSAALHRSSNSSELCHLLPRATRASRVKFRPRANHLVFAANHEDGAARAKRLGMRKPFLLAVLSAAVALGAACSSSSSGVTGDDTCGNCVGDDTAPPQDGGTDATLDGGDASCPVQSFPVNAAACPASYSATYAGQLCSPAGLQCNYPGAGDIGANGCPAPGALFCEFPDSGIGEIPDAAIFADAGDASVGYWTFAQ